MAIPKALTATARGTARAVNALLAAAITTAVLGGIPWGLLHYAGDPLPHSVPTLDAVKHTLTSTMSPQLLLKCLSVVGWYLWLILAVSFLVELVYAARRANSPHIPTLGPTQALAATLITAIGLTALLRAAPARAAEATVTPTGARVASTAPVLAGTSGLSAAHTAFGTTAGAPRESVHTVRPGESLYSIAKADLGDGEDWRALYRLNAGVVQTDGGRLTDPDLIRPDWKIRITPAADPATATTHTATVPQTHAPAATAPVPAQAAPTTAPAPPAGHGTADTPRRPTSAPHTATPAPSGTGDQGARAPRRHGDAAVGLPDGGAIGITLAVALGSAVVLARRWRTRLSDPRFPAPEPLLPGALLAARRAHLVLSAPSSEAAESTAEPAGGPSAPEDLYDVPLGIDTDPELELQNGGAESGAGGDRQDGDVDDDAIDGYFDEQPDDDAFSGEPDGEVPIGPDPTAGLGTRYGAPMAPGSIAAAERDGAEIPLPPTGPGLGLVGPGAAGAARAIAASVLSAGAPDRTADLARLIIPAADLAALLGVNTEALPGITAGLPELYVTTDLAAALEEAEVHALLRTRLLEETDTTSLDEMAELHPDQEDCPPLVLMASPTRSATGRITALIDNCSHLRITAVLLGAHPHSVTAFVEADGRTSGPGLAQWTGSRLFDLSADALADVLQLLAAAAGHQGAPLLTPLGPRAELTVVPTAPAPSPAPEADVQEPAGGTGSPDGDREEAATGVTTAPAVPDAAGQALAAPRLILVTDPAEQIAEDMLDAWETRPVRISVLGALRIEADRQPVTGLRSQARPLAALLAWKGATGISDEQMDTTCWPDEDDLDRVARGRQDGLKSLRGGLREATGRKVAQFVQLRDRRDYLFNPEHTVVDLWVFRALDAAAGAARDRADQLRWLEKAAGFCTGALLAEETSADFAWADWPRVTVKAEQVAVLTRYAELATEADRPDKALAALRQAAAMADDSEYIYRSMFDLLAALGRHAEIAAQMEVVNASADAMGADVSPATREHAYRLLRPAGAPATGRRPTP